MRKISGFGMGIRNICCGRISDEYQRQMENPKFADIVDLSDAEIHSIQTEIPDLPKELEQAWRNCFD